MEVNGLNLFQPLPAGGYQQLATGSNDASELTLDSWQLPEALEVTVAAGPDGSGIEAPTMLTPPPETDTTVAVPVVPTVC
jgi:hypothetical protein